MSSTVLTVKAPHSLVYNLRLRPLNMNKRSNAKMFGVIVLSLWEYEQYLIAKYF